MCVVPGEKIYELSSRACDKLQQFHPETFCRVRKDHVNHACIHMRERVGSFFVYQMLFTVSNFVGQFLHIMAVFLITIAYCTIANKRKSNKFVTLDDLGRAAPNPIVY